MLQNVARLASRALLRVSGSEADQFLQGLITKDIGCVHISGIIYAFLLNARGRIVTDLIIYKSSDGLLLETDANRINALDRTLKIYRLRKKVDIELVKNFSVYFAAELPTSANNSITAFEDPRVLSFGYRIIDKSDCSIKDELSEDDYMRLRIEWGIPEGFEEVGDQIALQMNGDIMNGISFEKGCYIGQELIARTHHTGMIRRRVLPISLADSAKGQIVGKTLSDDNNKRQGKILRSHNSKGLALVSLNHIGNQLFDEIRNPVDVFRSHWWPESIN